MLLAHINCSPPQFYPTRSSWIQNPEETVTPCMVAATRDWVVGCPSLSSCCWAGSFPASLSLGFPGSFNISASPGKQEEYQAAIKDRSFTGCGISLLTSPGKPDKLVLVYSLVFIKVSLESHLIQS